MTRSDLIRVVAADTNQPLALAEQLVDATFAAIRAALDANRRVDIDNFGEFEMRRYSARTERQPERVVEHPPHQQVVFRAKKEWRREAVMAEAAD